MPENTNVAALISLRKRRPTGRMTIGIDLGDRKSHFCVLNEQALVIARGFLPTTISAFRREFESLPPSLVAIEACGHSLWVSQALKVCGHHVLVGNPRKIRLITESDRKNDRVDAETVVMVGGYQEVEIDFVADNPGLTLFHCHQQLHMDFGFMTLFDYV